MTSPRKEQTEEPAFPKPPYSYCYDGSSDWSIGPVGDPQGLAVCAVHDRNDDRARAICRFLVQAANSFYEQNKGRELMSLSQQEPDTPQRHVVLPCEQLNDDVRLWDDLQFFAVMKLVNDCVVEFTVYDIIGWAMDGWPHHGAALFPESETTVGDPTDDFSKSEPYLTGDIHWDGCSNWYFDEQDRCALHFCGRADASRIGKLLDRLYDVAVHLLPQHTHNLKTKGNR